MRRVCFSPMMRASYSYKAALNGTKLKRPGTSALKCLNILHWYVKWGDSVFRHCVVYWDTGFICTLMKLNRRILLMTHTKWICSNFDVMISPSIHYNAFPLVPCTLPAVFITNLQMLQCIALLPFKSDDFCMIYVVTGWNCCMFHHLLDSACVEHPHLFIQPYLYKIIMNTRQVAAALLLYRRQNHIIGYTPINQSYQQFGEFNTLYKDLKKHLERFYTYYRMRTEQFDYMLGQIEHYIYKPNANWQCSISAEEKLAICIWYLYLLSVKSIKHVHHTVPIITHVEIMLCRDGYVQSSHRCLCIILCINIYEFHDFWW